MSGTVATKPVRDGSSTLLPGGGNFYDLSGTGAGPWLPMNLLCDSSGNPIAPALDSSLQALITNSSAALPAGSNLIGHVDGAVASGQTAASSNPIRTGSQARTSNVSGKSSGTVADDICTAVGAKIVKQYSIPEAEWAYAAASGGIVNTTTAVTIIASSAGNRNYVTSLQIAHDTLGAATEIALRDGAAGTVIWRGKLQTAAVEQQHITFPSPIKGTVGNLLEVVTLTAVTGGVYVNAQGYQAP